jgi:hypothetical protein
MPYGATRRGLRKNGPLTVTSKPEGQACTGLSWESGQGWRPTCAEAEVVLRIRS